MYRSIRAFSKTVPEVLETTGTVGGDPETEYELFHTKHYLLVHSLAQKNMVLRDV